VAGSAAGAGGVTQGDGYAVAHIDDLGDRYGFRTIRRQLGVTAFGVNAVAMPPGYATGRHWHDQQEELYFVHRGVIEMEFGDGSTQRLTAGAVARVDAATIRRLRNVGEEDAIYLCAGGQDGYVGRDGRVPEGEDRFGGPAPDAADAPGATDAPGTTDAPGAADAPGATDPAGATDAPAAGSDPPAG
jgi:mannose-6-phosphate isomerase-like protein (cupin superfamily)